MPMSYIKLADDYEAVLEDLLNNAEQELLNQLLITFKQIQTELELAALTALIEEDDDSEVITILSYLFTNFALSYVSQFHVMSQVIADFISNSLNNSFIYNPLEETVVQNLRTSVQRITNGLLNSQLETIRQQLLIARSQQLSVKEIARKIQSSIGLSPLQQQAVDNYRRLLEQKSRRALTRSLRDKSYDELFLLKKPLSQKQIEIMVERYAENYRQYKIKNIAESESQRLIHESSDEVFHQGIISGFIDEKNIKRTWVTKGDEKVRGTHSTMHGQIRQYGVPFISGGGVPLMYPKDVNAPNSETDNCRCVVLYQFK